MAQRTLNLFCTGRDALIHDWELGAAVATIYAYRVFNTDNGYGIAGQMLCLDLTTLEYSILVSPTRLIDGLQTLTKAVQWMRTYARSQWSEISYEYRSQEIMVLEGYTEDGVPHE